MLSPVFPQPAIKVGGRTKGVSRLLAQSALQVNLGSPFRVLLDVDSDAETPSPLSICFDIPKASSPTKTNKTTAWADSDSDFDSECELDTDDSQCISILSDSPFYLPPPPATFQTTFDLPPVDSSSSSAAELFHAELARIIPSEMQRELYLVDEDALRGMEDELFAAPMDAFMDVCLARLRPASTVLPLPLTGGHNAQNDSEGQEPVDAAGPRSAYYLASFLDLQRHSTASSLSPSLYDLFKRTIPSMVR